jgi:hypothetical protein
MTTIIHMLDALADLNAQRDLLNIQKADLIDRATPPEVKMALADIESEFSGHFENVDKQIAAITADVKEAVIAEGATVKGTNLQAVFAKGRTSWDSKKLEGLAIALPQLLEARTIGEPSVSIRAVK